LSQAAPGPYNKLTIDLEAIAHNLRALRTIMPKGLRVAGTVKSDGYGHGMVAVARKLKEAGAEFLAVAHAAEGAVLRREGLAGQILLLLGLHPSEMTQAARLRLTPVLFDLETMAALSDVATGLGLRAQCHLKVDTGMGRLGVRPEDALELLRAAKALRGLDVRGLTSHLATGGSADRAMADEQAAVFGQLLAAARAEGFDLPDSSLCNSGGAMDPPAAAPGPPHVVRLGIALYGGLPDPAMAGRLGLRGAMGLASQLIAVRPARRGQPVSYGCTWRADCDTWLGVVPLGYGDGYPRAASNNGFMLVHGQRAPIVGRVCMNLTVLDLGGFDPLPQVGDEVVALGGQGADEITCDELASWCQTISYEIVCRLGAANPRIHEPA